MAFNSGFSEEQEVMAEINMTPLVDVMLVLLIIFIITVPVLTHSIKVELPTVAATPTQESPQVLTLAVTGQGQLLWQQQRVTLDELAAILEGIARQVPQPPIELQGDAAVPYQYVVEVMALAQKSGVASLGFITQVRQE